MDDISRELSISKKTIYQYFRDKNEIVCKVTDAYLKNEKEKMDKIKAEANDAIEQLYGYSSCIRDLFGKINPVVLYDLRKYYKKAWQIYLNYKNEVFYHSIISTLNDGIREGFFRRDIDVEVLAVLRLEEFQLTMDQSLYPVEKFDLKNVQIQLFNHFIYGIVTEAGYKKLNHYFKNHTLS